MHVTALYAALLTFLYLVLSARVIGRRRETQVSLGEGGDRVLQRRIRAHANCAEYAPLGLLLILLAETLATPAWWLHVLGILLLAGRLAHAVALSSPGGNMALRTGGMTLTFGALTLASLTTLKAALFAY